MPLSISNHSLSVLREPQEDVSKRSEVLQTVVDHLGSDDDKQALAGKEERAAFKSAKEDS